MNHVGGWRDGAGARPSDPDAGSRASGDSTRFRPDMTTSRTPSAAAAPLLRALSLGRRDPRAPERWLFRNLSLALPPREIVTLEGSTGSRRISPSDAPRSSRAGSGRSSRWCACSSPSPGSCCWTSPRPRWTPPPWRGSRRWFEGGSGAGAEGTAVRESRTVGGRGRTHTDPGPIGEADDEGPAAVLWCDARRSPGPSRRRPPPAAGPGIARDRGPVTALAAALQVQPGYIRLEAGQLALATALIVVNGAISLGLRLGIERELAVPRSAPWSSWP